MSGRARADHAVKVKGSNPAWLDRDRERVDGRTTNAATKVKRYRAGEQPEFARDAGEGSSDDDADDDADDARVGAAANVAGGRRVAAAPVIVARAGGDLGSRRRPAEAVVVARGGGGDLGARATTTTTTTTAAASVDLGEPDSEDEDEIARRRAATRARILARQKEEEDKHMLPIMDEDDDDGGLLAGLGVGGGTIGVRPGGGGMIGGGGDDARATTTAPRPVGKFAGKKFTLSVDDDDATAAATGTTATGDLAAAAAAGASAAAAAAADDDDGSSSWETDTDASDSDDPGGGGGPGRVMVKPTFVPKRQRETIAEREKVEAEMDAEHERREAHKRKRATESKQLAAIEVDMEKQIAAMEAANDQGGTNRMSDVDTDDDPDDVAAFEAWQRREQARREQEAEIRRKFVEEREEQERIRRMSEEEKEAWLAANPRENAETGGKEKQKLGFLQKYYHKGAFFQEAADDPASSMGTDDIYKRDFNQATGADKVDKSALPKAMQVRGDAFGKIGRTKWTHLSAEDTTFAGGDNVWADARNKRVGELAEKGAGRKQEFQKPKRIDK